MEQTLSSRADCRPANVAWLTRRIIEALIKPLIAQAGAGVLCEEKDQSQVAAFNFYQIFRRVARYIHVLLLGSEM